MRTATRLLVVAALAFAACGDDDAGQTDATASDTPTTRAAVPTAAPAAATTEAPTQPPGTTTLPVATTEPAPTGADAFIAAAAGYVREYEGNWVNNTFGSTGGLYANLVEVNTDAGFMLIQIDLDGNVFGLADPDPFVIEIYTVGENLEVGGGGGVFGEVAFDIDESGTFTLTAMPPGLGTMTVTGNVVEDGFEGTYVIESLADGIWNAAALP